MYYRIHPRFHLYISWISFSFFSLNRKYVAYSLSDVYFYTLNEASKLEDSNRTINIYPNDIPFTLEELTDTWRSLPLQTEGLTQFSKRLIVCAPQKYPWPEIYETWDKVVYNPSVKDCCEDLFYEEVFSCIFADV